MKRNIVKMDYRLNNARYKLNTSEIKFISTVIAQINKDDKEFKTYKITISQLEEKFQTEQNETRLKQFARRLMSKPLELPTETGWKMVNWFSMIEYIKGQAKFEVRIDKDLKPYLLELKERFVKYNLHYVFPLKSKYSIRIYQLLKEYQKIGERRFNLKELQELLSVPKSYKIYNRFKEKIILVAKKEIKEHTDIYFEFEEIKEVRKVVAINFLIYNQNKASKAEKDDKPVKNKKTTANVNNRENISLTDLKEQVLNGLSYIDFKRKLMRIQNTDIANFIDGYYPQIILRTNAIGHLELYDPKNERIISLEDKKDKEKLEELRKWLYKHPERIGELKEIDERKILLEELKNKLEGKYDLFKKDGIYHCLHIKNIDLQDNRVKITGDDVVENKKNISISIDLNKIDEYAMYLKDKIDEYQIDYYRELNEELKSHK